MGTTATPSGNRPEAEPVDAEVMIVGAGPVGLLLANFLGARGISTVVCDRRSGPPTGSMAIGVTPPSLEILRPLGLDRALWSAGVPVRHAEVHEAGLPLGRIDFAGIDSEYRFFLSIPQRRTVEVLRDNLSRYACVQLREGCEFEGLEERSDGVLARFAMSEGTKGASLKACFLVGCDGHRGRVREAVGLKLEAREYPQRFVMADFEDASGLRDEARLFFSPEASVESFPLPGGWRRWILQVDGLPAEDDPRAQLVRHVARLTGFDLHGSRSLFVHAFGAKRGVVGSYHRGRVVLAGDAAHVMSSIGGQGMNTGFADAELLAEVLPLVLARPERQAAEFRAYDRLRRAAFHVAATRAERGMWLGTLKGRSASWVRRCFIRRVLFGPLLRHRLAPHFAMLTIPGSNLRRTPSARLIACGLSHPTP